MDDAERYDRYAARRCARCGQPAYSEAELERVLLGFMKHEYDIFVSTTIVENGLDIPLANTMIIGRIFAPARPGSRRGNTAVAGAT